MKIKQDIRDLSFEELAAELKDLGEPAYRAGQVFDWLYKRGAASFDAFTDLPKSLRFKLEEGFLLKSLVVAERLVASDKIEKFLFRLADGNFIESVLIPAGKRNTLCLSTQVGCKFGCAFCASGMGGFKRNLRPSEILGQVLILQDKLSLNLTNFVFMGMGEPLDNCDSVVKAIKIMNDPRGMEIAARRITVSTVGIVLGIERLKKLGLQVNLSLSLHAVREELRSKLLPVSRKYPLPEILRACEEYIKETGRMMTLEYILLGGLNDTAEDAAHLASIARRLRAKVNLIPCSPVPGLDFFSPPAEANRLFLKTLKEKGVNATLRQSKGADIQAACGQLAGKLRKT
ncbi:MAG: 23S rRNA (adenine(2503)-C(2))-methyltransferase RlmN [Clostridiales bacterium]|nr:23S rRNA (adenine(2503)-C(2))-methyltransferase RlmN [Clostridiales bacterium]